MELIEKYADRIHCLQRDDYLVERCFKVAEGSLEGLSQLCVGENNTGKTKFYEVGKSQGIPIGVMTRWPDIDEQYRPVFLNRSFLEYATGILFLQDHYGDVLEVEVSRVFGIVANMGLLFESFGEVNGDCYNMDRQTENLFRSPAGMIFMGEGKTIAGDFSQAEPKNIFKERYEEIQGEITRRLDEFTLTRP